MRQTKREYEARYRASHKEHLVAYFREYHRLHPEKNRERCKRYYNAHREIAKTSAKKYRDSHKEERRIARQQPAAREMERAGHVRRKYKLSPEECRRLIAKQTGRCAICAHLFNEANYWCVDHDHQTNRIRALLCHKCNSALGLFLENEDVLLNAVAYLRRHKIRGTRV